MEYGYNDEEANALLQKLDMRRGAGGHDGRRGGAISKSLFREVYAVFLTDLADRGQDIAKREQDRVLTKRGFPPENVATYTQDLLCEVTDRETIDLISAILASRWEEILRAKGYSEQSALEAALGVQADLVEEEILQIVRPLVAGRTDQTRRLIDRQLAHKAHTLKKS